MRELIEGCWAHEPNTRPTASEALRMLERVQMGEEGEYRMEWSTFHAACVAMEEDAAVSVQTQQVFLGVIDRYRMRVRESFDDGFSRLKQAAKHSGMEEQFAIGFMYANGLGVAGNDKEAVTYYQLAADQRFPPAQTNLAQMYASGRGVLLDDEKAVSLFRLAADQGYPAAQCCLGRRHELGEGVERDPRKAFQLYQAAADQGNAAARCNLGSMYLEGTAVDKDVGKAASLFQLAADQGLAGALFNLAQMYYRGIGVGKDKRKAIALTEAAAAKGHPQAQRALSEKKCIIC